MQGRQHVHGKFHILPLESKCLEIKNISCNRYKPKRMNTRQNTEVSNSAKATCRLIAESKNLLQHALFLKSRFSQCFRERKKIKLNLCSFKSTWASFPSGEQKSPIKKVRVTCVLQKKLFKIPDFEAISLFRINSCLASVKKNLSLSSLRSKRLTLATQANPLRPPQSSRFFVAELQIFCRGQLG